jgi:hypothetical protein
MGNEISGLSVTEEDALKNGKRRGANPTKRNRNARARRTIKVGGAHSKRTPREPYSAPRFGNTTAGKYRYAGAVYLETPMHEESPPPTPSPPPKPKVRSPGSQHRIDKMTLEKIMRARSRVTAKNNKSRKLKIPRSKTGLRFSVNAQPNPPQLTRGTDLKRKKYGDDTEM